MSYIFETFDPRPIPEAEKHNNLVFGKGPVLGIEVTVPILADRCFYNIDPQHGSSPSNRAAIEEAVSYNPLPKGGTVLATVKPDLDSVGSMAVLSMRYRAVSLKAFSGSIALIAKSDQFDRGDWPGVKKLPGMDGSDLWIHPHSKVLAPIALYVGDHSVSFKSRVIAMEEWIVNQVYPGGYEEKALAQRLVLARVLESGEISHSMHCEGKICLVESVHRAATEVGYSQAPVVVALNPQFRLPGGGTIRKFTICTYREKYVDIAGALVELAKLEFGWGGSRTIGESSQAQDSTLCAMDVVSVVANHLK